MQADASQSLSPYEEITRFVKTHARPDGGGAIKSRVKPPKSRDFILSAVFVALPIAGIMVVQSMLGVSFIGDILVFGLIGFALVGIVYALSTFGAYFLSQRKKTPAQSWVAAAILDQETHYDEGIPQKKAVLELEDGRRITVAAKSDLAEAITPGKVGWANIHKSDLINFVSG